MLDYILGQVTYNETEAEDHLLQIKRLRNTNLILGILCIRSVGFDNPVNLQYIADGDRLLMGQNDNWEAPFGDLVDFCCNALDGDKS